MSITTDTTNDELLKLLGEVKDWIEVSRSRNNNARDLEYERDLAKRLNAYLEPNSAFLERSPKKPKITDEVMESNAGEHDKKSTKDVKDIIRLIIDKCEDIDPRHDFFRTEENESVALHGLVDRHSNWEEKFNIWSVYFRGNEYKDDDHCDEKYDKLERSLSPMKNVEGALNDLFNSNQDSDGGKDIIKWDENFVIAKNLTMKDEPPDFNFALDLTKSAAVVITGESGSGKSWFVKKWLPSMHPNASFIYHELDDDDAKGFGDFQPKDERLENAYQNAMEDLGEIDKLDSEVYQAVNELSRQNNFERNESARERVDKILEKAVKNDSTVERWWENPEHCRLEELVIILDDMCKAPNLVRGIVDEVRQISIRICNRKLAKNVMLVIVGSGLDYYLPENDAYSSEKVKFFRTDPMKFNVTILNGPNLEDKDTIGGISTKDIMGGTYSQVLATNTRMLTRGIIPILKSRLNTFDVDNLSSRRVELGSTNVVMDYAARVYVDFNALKKLSPDKRDSLLLKQFRILVQQYRLKYKNTELTNPAFEWSVPTLSPDYKAVLRAGLITADVIGTSKALRYLACKGQTAPLNAQDGIAFEVVLQHHLARLCRAEYQGQDETYYCDRYALVQPWPPLSTTKMGLAQKENVEMESESRYDNEKTKNRLKDDAVEIAKLVEGKNEYDLVLRQTISNVQGADVLVLSKRSKDQNANLDLYQAKHYNKIPSRASKETIGAFASLGICYEPQENVFRTQPQIGSAAYSFMGTNKFAEKLSQKLKITVSVRKRVVVFSKSWKSFLKSSWKDFDFEAAKNENMWIWPREMVEPTISALVTGPAFKISSEGDELAPE